MIVYTAIICKVSRLFEIKATDIPVEPPLLMKDQRMTSEPILTCTVTDGLAHITLNNPAGGNALDPAMIDAFAAAALALDAQEVRAVLISAVGKNFCVGGDIKAFLSSSDAGKMIGGMAGRLHEGVVALNALGCPIVVAVNGAAAGAGLSLAVSGDIVIAAESSSFAMAYTAIGLSPDGGASYFLPRLIGVRRTQEMAYLNKRVLAAEALDWGLVTRVVPDADLLAEAEKIATQLSKGPTSAFRSVKTLLDTSGNAALQEQLDCETAAISKAAGSADGKEGVTAFLEKRKAAFTGA